MYASLVILLLLPGLLGQCGNHADQAKREPTTSNQQADSPVQKTDSDECDFSIYKPIREDHFVQRTVVKKIKPTYPPDAVQRGIQGRVFVKILVNLDGDVEKVCSGNLEEPLNRASVTAALQWKFKRNFGLSGARRNSYREAIIVFHFVLDKAEKTVSPNAVTVHP